MPVNEKIILGIPLDINRMDAEDWDSLPGIGPVMALRILSDRQINGDYRSVSDLQRVPGTGKNKIKQLEKFFNKR
jgi:competence protein ComEA